MAVDATRDDLLETAESSAQRGEIGERVEQDLEAFDGALVAGLQDGYPAAHDHRGQLALAGVELKTSALRGCLDGHRHIELIAGRLKH